MMLSLKRGTHGMMIQTAAEQTAEARNRDTQRRGAGINFPGIEFTGNPVVRDKGRACRILDHGTARF
jgi:hypothetical protein